MPVLRLFAAAREAAGVARADLDGVTVGELLDAARDSFGDRFSDVLERSRVWVNGEPATADTPVDGHDVVAVLPPVSGGAVELAVAPPPTLGPRSAGAGSDSRRSVPRVHGRRRQAVPGPPGAATGTGPGGPGPGSTSTAPAAPATAEDGPRATAWGWSDALTRWAVVHDTTRPHGRLGVAWAGVTVAVTVAGVPWLGAWMAVAALAGASQAAAARRTAGERPPPAVAAMVGVVLPILAVMGVRDVVLGVLGALLISLLTRSLVINRRVSRNLSLAVLMGTVAGAAAAATVLTRAVSAEAALFLLACACTYDAGAYLVGTGASAVWEGPTAGVVALIPVSILAAVVLVPPFPSGTPLALGLLAAVLAPMGPLAATALLGSREADAPGLRRLDSLIFLAPAWAWLVTTILH
jgi:molybdopterin synthase sulfur carrier subunit